jgi:hypothetical protein
VSSVLDNAALAAARIIKQRTIPGVPVDDVVLRLMLCQAFATGLAVQSAAEAGATHPCTCGANEARRLLSQSSPNSSLGESK